MMWNKTLKAIVFASSACAMPVAAQSNTWVSLTAGPGLALAQDQAYADNVVVAARGGLGHAWRNDWFSEFEVLVTRNLKLGADVCIRVDGRCPQFYAIEGLGLLAGRQQRGRSPGSRRGMFGMGLGVYSIDTESQGRSTAFGVQADLGLVFHRQRGAAFSLDVKALLFPEVRRDNLLVIPLTVGVRF